MTDKMTITEALEHSRRELEAYKLKAKDRPFYQRAVDYYEIVVEALKKQIEVDCDKCDSELCGMCIHNLKMADCYKER